MRFRVRLAGIVWAIVPPDASGTSVCRSPRRWLEIALIVTLMMSLKAAAQELYRLQPQPGDSLLAPPDLFQLRPATQGSQAWPSSLLDSDVLQAGYQASAGEQPAIATPDDDGRTGTFSWFSAWQGRGDPSIETAKQQTVGASTGKDSLSKKKEGKKWFEKLTVRGYAQFRHNEIISEDPDSAPPQHVGDRSVGHDQNFLIRRARVIISGDVSEYLYVYLQPDFASSVPGSPDATYFAQIRDWYGDCYLDPCKVHRLRVGQSKVPYGWENMQSSSNRVPLDRNDGLNSAVRNERDLGVFYYWTPQPAQEFFKTVLEDGYKGSGNYGMFGLGVYNGQGGSFIEQNDNLHVVARLTLPMELSSGQYVEVGVQGYTGMYTVLSTAISPLGVGAPVRPDGTLETGNRAGIRDERIAGTFVWYPQPFGFQTEWNVGRGPGLNAAQTEVEERALYGGYAMLLYRYDSPCHGIFFPFARYNHYTGGYKAERNAPFSHIDEWEAGVEWQINPQMELTTSYAITDRTNTVAFSEAGVESYRQFDGDLLRFQFQINY